MALGTIVWDQYAGKGTYRQLPPHYKEYNDIDDLMDNLTHLKNMLYNPNYIIVEFNGTIYNASGYGIQAQRRDNIALYNAMYEYKRQQDKANEMIK